MLYTLYFLVVLVVLYYYIRRTPHGLVEFKSGVVLKFLPSLDGMHPKKVRVALEKYVARGAARINRKLPVKIVKDFSIPTRHGDIGARLYRNNDEPADQLICFIHGGGWCIGSIDTHNEQTRRIALATGLPVLSLNYSLSPEVKFPQAFEECTDALKWSIEQYTELGASRPQLVIMGDSAGGNLSITTALQLIKDGMGQYISHVIPVYPVVDGRKNDRESYRMFGTGFYLTAKAMKNFKDCYIAQPDDVNDPRTSPILEKDLSQFPPVFILTAGFDPLRDEGEEFARRLHDQGVPVTLKRYPNVLHAFFGIESFGQSGLQAVDDVAAYLKGNPVSQTTSF